MNLDDISRAVQSPLVLAPIAFVGVLLVAWPVIVAATGRGPQDSLRRKLGKALRPPLWIGALAIAASCAGIFTSDASSADRWLAMSARIGFVLAVGIALTRVGEVWLRRRIGQLELDVEDNLAARRTATRLGILRRIWSVLFIGITIVAALTVIPQFRSLGLSLFASAGVAGLVIGIAAGPVLTNLFAGIQIAMTQPMRIDDAVVVEGEWGWIEEIGLFHVVIRLWDLRRLVVPLRYFIDTPFQNWTRESASIIGTVTWRLDYTAPVAAIRTELDTIVKSHPLWDGKVVVLQVTDAGERTIELRALASAVNSPRAWDLRCDIRERIIAWLQANHPGCLPRMRFEESERSEEAAQAPPAGEVIRDPALRADGAAVNDRAPRGESVSARPAAPEASTHHPPDGRPGAVP